MSTVHENMQIVILKGKRERYGILVDELGPIPRINTDKIDFNASLLDAADKFTEGVVLPVDSKSHTELVVLLDPTRLINHLVSIGTFKGKLREFV